MLKSLTSHLASVVDDASDTPSNMTHLSDCKLMKMFSYSNGSTLGYLNIGKKEKTHITVKISETNMVKIEFIRGCLSYQFVTLKACYNIIKDIVKSDFEFILFAGAATRILSLNTKLSYLVDHNTTSKSTLGIAAVVESENDDKKTDRDGYVLLKYETNLTIYPGNDTGVWSSSSTSRIQLGFLVNIRCSLQKVLNAIADYITADFASATKCQVVTCQTQPIDKSITISELFKTITGDQPKSSYDLHSLSKIIIHSTGTSDKTRNHLASSSLKTLKTATQCLPTDLLGSMMPVGNSDSPLEGIMPAKPPSILIVHNAQKLSSFSYALLTESPSVFWPASVIKSHVYVLIATVNHFAGLYGTIINHQRFSTISDGCNMMSITSGQTSINLNDLSDRLSIAVYQLVDKLTIAND